MEKSSYRVTSLSAILQIGKEPERELTPSEYGYFDENRNFVFYDNPWGTDYFFPWEWIYMPDVVEYAIECSIELPDGAVDFSKTF